MIVRAPGRVNLIGEHTDYNDGFVLPMAIDRAIWIAVRPRMDRTVCIHSVDFAADTVFSLDDLEKEQGWAEYLKGIAYILQADGHHLSGWDGVMMGDVPLGSGLSSSAAVELATARVFASVSDLEWNAAYMARTRSTRGESMGGRELRHHGSNGERGLQRRPCTFSGLPLA